MKPDSKELFLLFSLLAASVAIVRGQLNPCQEVVVPNPHAQNLTVAAEENRKGLETNILIESVKQCKKSADVLRNDVNHFHVAGVNQSLILEIEICGSSVIETDNLIKSVVWEVLLRSDAKHISLFGPAFKSVDEKLQTNVVINKKIPHLWRTVASLPFAQNYCITKGGKLNVIKFQPEKMAGTYKAKNYAKDASEEMIYHHLDYVYDSEESFDGRVVRGQPQLAPKASMARMFTTQEKNLRYKHRVLNATLLSMRMRHKEHPNILLYPKKFFEASGIKLLWSPPPRLTQFTDWKPQCGPRIIRDRYQRCTIEVDESKLKAQLTNRIIKDMAQLELASSRKMDSGLVMPVDQWPLISLQYLLYHLVKRLPDQLQEEAQESPERRSLYIAGFRSLDNGKFQVPCHYTYLHHMPNMAIYDEMATAYIPSIANIGEREEAIRPCGLADPMDLLRMMGKVLVEQLKKIVALTKQRPVVPQRSVIYNGKNMYMKCPTDPYRHEKPACSIPGKEDNILWTLNGKTIRFFGEEVERGAALSPTCGLTIKKITYNDAGEYTCYRTPLGAKSIEDTPAYRHFVEVIPPDYDPPPIEEVYFGLAVCFAWNGFLMLLWMIIATVKGLLTLLCRTPETRVKQEVWTSFYINNPALDDDEADDEDDEEDDDEDWEQDSNDDTLDTKTQPKNNRTTNSKKESDARKAIGKVKPSAKPGVMAIGKGFLKGPKGGAPGKEKNKKD